MKLAASSLISATRASDDLPRQSSDASHRLDAAQHLLIELEGFISLSGFGGGVYMVTHRLTAMSLRYLHGTWFHTWRMPGIALLFFVGICPAIVLVAALRHHNAAPIGHVVVGFGLIAWVTLEAAWIVVAP